MEQISKAFTQKYGVEVVVEMVAFGDIRDKLKVAGPAGEGPDIIEGPHDWLGELVSSGLIAPIDLGDKKELYLPAALQAFTYNGKLYGVPRATENVALFRNTTLVPEAPTTLDEMVAIAAQLESEGKAKYGFLFAAGDSYHFFPIMTAFGGYVFGRDSQGNYYPQDVGLDSPGSIAAAQWLDWMVKNHHLSADVDWETMHVLFQNGQVGMIISGPWALDRIRTSGVPYAVSAVPNGPQEARPFIGVRGFMVSAFSKNPLLVQTYLQEFLATEEVMTQIYTADPAASAFLPVREKITDPDIAAFSEAGKNGLSMPAIPEMSAVWSAWGDAVMLIFQQRSAPDVAFKNAAQQIRTAIEGTH
jgi:maltose/maltodextrin transport system substrate-binding protein/arabinogalactan oligomer/maltooligosaccharide transport system substrate-binding protein